GSVAAHRVHGLRGDHQSLAGAVRPRLHAVNLILERALDDIDDLFARMPVPDGLRRRADLDSVLDHLTPRSVQVVVLKIGPLDARCLRLWRAGQALLRAGQIETPLMCGGLRAQSRFSGRVLRWSADGLERCAELFAEQLRLLPGGEVPALVSLVEVG